jgi:predicted nucleotidyltransferase
VALEERLTRRFAPLRDDVLGVMLWGSAARGEDALTPQSDVDVCLVAGPNADPVETLRRAWRTVDLDGFDHRVDLHVFEELPRHLQGAVIDADHVLVTPDEPGLYEYLYPYRKLWDDQRHRHELTHDEALEILRRGGGEA